MSRALLAHLAGRFVTQREDLATEALLFVLDESSVARASLLRLLTSAGCSVPTEARFKSQAVGLGGERPDMVGVDVRGHERVLVEAKFWAGLTDNQPVTYLARLEESGSESGVLVFMAPDTRLEALWPELSTRIADSGRTIGERQIPISGVLAAPIGDLHLVLLSWRTVLDHLAEDLAESGEKELLESLGQLQVLCEWESGEDKAFLPVQYHEIASTLPARLFQFRGLIDDAVARLFGEGLVDTEGLRSADGTFSSGRYFRLAGVVYCMLEVNLRNWSKVAMTPMWLHVYGKDWKLSAELQQVFEKAADTGQLESYELPRKGKGMQVPIYIPLGIGREETLDSIVTDVRKLAAILEEEDLPSVLGI